MKLNTFPYGMLYHKLPKKWLLVMKITFVLLLATFMCVSASTLAQKITLNTTNANLKTVLKEFKKQSGYNFVVDEQVLDNAQKVTLDLKNVDIRQALDQIVEAENLTYTISDKVVTIQEKQLTILDKLKSAINLNQIDVTGIVVDEQGRPVTGATVTIKSTGNATITNAKGEFNLRNVSDNATIIISFIGYQKQELPVAAHMGEIKLVVSENELDAVQVIAYGETTQRLNTGDVSSVSAKEIEEQPVSNPLAALEGKVPGMFITQETGVSGSAFSVQIRGQNSLANGTDPLYVVDGVPYSSELLPGNGLILGTAGFPNFTYGSYGSPLSFINPNDIERIDILKDADATSIYGTRGANGVVLITTKKGKAGKTKVDLNVNSGIGAITHAPTFLNTQQYLAMRNEAFKNDGTSPVPGQDVDVLGGDTWDTTRYTNWEKLLIGNTSHYTDASATISGGNENTQFLVGGGYHRETTVFPGDLADQKASLHFSINNRSSDGKFKMQFSGSYMADINNLIANDLTSFLGELAPDAPPVFNANGTLNWANSTWPSGGNPYAELLQTFTAKTDNLVSNLQLSYEIVKGLEFKINSGYTDMQVNENEEVPTSYFDPAYNITSGRAFFTNNNIKTWILEPQLTYQLKLGKGMLNSLLGSTFQQTAYDGQVLNATGYNSDALLQNLQDATSITASPVTNILYRYESVFARLNYNLNDEYLINLTGRRDGSSRFGPGDQFANFGAAGFAWIFSKEKTVQNLFPFLSFGKARASYGTTGSDQIGDYKYLDLYTNTYLPYNGSAGLYPNNLFNPALAWEVTKKLEFGLELGFLKDDILLNADYYRNRSSNQLVSTTVSGVTGFTSIESNLPAVVQNTGFEFSLTTVNIKRSDFSWKSSINLTIPNNKLVSFPGLSTSVYADSYIIGQPITIIRTFRFADVNPTTGLYEFFDSQGNKTYNPVYPNDLTATVNLAPKYYGGLSNSFTYKSFSLDFLFQYVNKIGPNYLYGVSPGTFGHNQPVSVLGRWQNKGDVTNIQEFSAGYGTQAFTQYLTARYNSNQLYEDASYLRLKNLSISYNVPESIKRSLHIQQNIRVYIQGQNLLTFTKYKGFDPENTSSSSLPPLKVLTAGLQLTL
jgi:TonB-linked SusC/RagA family outer membrane protein